MHKLYILNDSYFRRVRFWDITTAVNLGGSYTVLLLERLNNDAIFLFLPKLNEQQACVNDTVGT